METDNEILDNTKSKSRIPLNVSASQRPLVFHENPQTKFQDNITQQKLPNRLNFSSKFWKISEDRDEISRGVPSFDGHGLRSHLNNVLSQKIDWTSLRKMFKTWIKNPMNMALFAWISIIAISGAILFLVMTGMLNRAIPNKNDRNVWFEVNNQILNALFTLMCLYQHPKRFYHLVLLCRWRSQDISKLRNEYCKNGTYKPHEWGHMMAVVLLLHLNCFAQYALCSLNLGYKRSERPVLGVGICISFAIAAPTIAGVYTIVSPLGKDYNFEFDEESQLHKTISSDPNRPGKLKRGLLEKRFSFASSDEPKVIEITPLWKGGIFDFWDDITLAYLSLFCTFCVFGWNMERLGFGNMYVHIATFLLFCLAPFWIFNLAAVNIDNETVRSALGVTGIVLCVFGLLYGGFWRIQMRKRFNLPEYRFCCGNPEVTDCSLWLFCCWCSLAQEARTGNSYDMVEDKFCRNELDNLSREGRIVELNSGPSSPYKTMPSPNRHLPSMDEKFCISNNGESMSPPIISVMENEFGL